ncbi:MAG: hypothetical protein ACR2N1_17640 [Rubripirellula sp.]
MKHVAFLLAGFATIVGCSDRDDTAPPAPPNSPSVSTDIQDDLWHAHRHVHDNIQVHDHEHTDGFVGGHEHPHGHTHRHAETVLGGIVVSLQRNATAGQLPGGGIAVPPRPHLEILPGLPAELNVCLLSQELPSASTENGSPASNEADVTANQTHFRTNSTVAPPDDGGWSYWNPELAEITLNFQLEGTKYTLTCEKRIMSSEATGNASITAFRASLPEDLRVRLTSTKARLRVAKFTVEVGKSRLRVSEQVYFQGEELSVFLQ